MNSGHLMETSVGVLVWEVTSEHCSCLYNHRDIQTDIDDAEGNSQHLEAIPVIEKMGAAILLYGAANVNHEVQHNHKEQNL